MTPAPTTHGLGDADSVPPPPNQAQHPHLAILVKIGNQPGRHDAATRSVGWQHERPTTIVADGFNKNTPPPSSTAPSPGQPARSFRARHNRELLFRRSICTSYFAQNCLSLQPQPSATSDLISEFFRHLELTLAISTARHFHKPLFGLGPFFYSHLESHGCSHSIFAPIILDAARGAQFGLSEIVGDTLGELLGFTTTAWAILPTSPCEQYPP